MIATSDKSLVSNELCMVPLQHDLAVISWVPHGSAGTFGVPQDLAGASGVP